MKNWVSSLAAACPLRIERTSWEDPILVLGGADWNFACTSTWRIANGERMLVGCEDPEAAHEVASLSGRVIDLCINPSWLGSGDLRLVLDDGRMIEIFVASAIDPWAFRIPGLTIVPSPTAPEW
jgi:hypothetical protein